MRKPAVPCLVVLICLFFVISGCSKKEEPVPVQAPPPASEQPAARETKAPAKESQMNKVLAVHKEFSAAFSDSLGSGDTVEAIRDRMVLVDRTRVNSMILRSDVNDPEAAEFLIRFTDLLQRYMDLGTRHIATLEEVDRLHALAKEKEGGLAALQGTEKAKATREFNTIVDQHNGLVQGPLAQERKDLETLGKELMEIR